MLERENEILHREIVELKTTIKKYDYEIDFLTNKTHVDTEDFIKNLQRSRKSVIGETNLNSLDPDFYKMKASLMTPKNFPPKFLSSTSFIGNDILYDP